MNDLLTIYDVLALPSGAHVVSDHGQVTLLVASHEGPNKLTLERVPLGPIVAVEAVIAALTQRGLLYPEQVTPQLEGGAWLQQDRDPGMEQTADETRRGAEPVDPATAPLSAPTDPETIVQDQCQQPTIEPVALGATPPALPGHADTQGRRRMVPPNHTPTPQQRESSLPAQQNPGQASKQRSGPAKGFTYARVACERCGASIARNQVIAHGKHCPGPLASIVTVAATPEPEPDPVPAPAPEPEPEPVQPTPAAAQACAGCGVLFGPDRVEKQPYAVVDGQPRCETCATGSVYGRRAA